MDVQLNVSIFEYLSNVVNDSPQKSVLESHLKALASGLNVDTSLKSGVDLVKIFKDSNPPAMPQASNTGVTEESFKKYLELLQKRGYFNGTTEGGEEYKTRLEKARTRFFAKFTDNPIPSSEKSEQQPTDPLSHLSPEEKQKKGNDHKNKGNSLLNEKKYEEAIEEYNWAIKCSPSNAIYFANRGLAFQKLNDHHSAINDFQHALKCDPKYSKAYHRLGHSYLAIHDNEKAAKTVEDGLAIEPSNTSLLQLQQELNQQQQPDGPGGMGFPGFPGFPGMGGGGQGGVPNFMELMNNPEFMNAATQMIQNNPQFMNMVQQVAQNPQLLNNLFGTMGGGIPGMPPMGPGGMGGGPGGMGGGPGGMGGGAGGMGGGAGGMNEE